MLTQQMTASGETLDRLLDDPTIDTAGQILTRGGVGQFLEAEPGAIRRTHAQQNLEARIGRRRTQR